MGICEGLELPSTLPVERKLEGALDPHLSGLLSGHLVGGSWEGVRGSGDPGVNISLRRGKRQGPVQLWRSGVLEKIGVGQY